MSAKALRCPRYAGGAAARIFDVVDAPSGKARCVCRFVAQAARRGHLGPVALDVVRVEGWWEDAGKHWQHLADIGRRVDETGANG